MNDELISRSALLDYFEQKAKSCRHNSTEQNVWQSAFEAVQDEPYVDAEPVRHGRWIQSRQIPCLHTCSHCKAAHRLRESCNTFILLNYCPDCGAKMDAEG